MRALLAVLVALPLPALAQDDSRGETPAEVVDGLTDEGEEVIERQAPSGPGADVGIDAIPQKAGGSARFQGRIRTEYAEVMAGPGAAYLGRGRVYQNDVVQVLRRNESGDWLEVESAGLQGWIRSRYVEVTRGAPMVNDPGKDRRQTNYRYDGRGRRLRPDGTPAGSGEGAAGDESEESVQDEPSADEAPPARGDGALHLRPFAGLGAGQVKRVFDSNIDLDASPLRHATAEPYGLALTLGVEWAPLVYFALAARFDGVFLGSTHIPASESLGFEKAVDLEVSGWQGGLDAHGRYPLGPAWVGAYAGGRVQRQNYQKTKQYPIFLTGTIYGAAFGGAAGVDLPVGLTAAARGGLVMPLSVSQEPDDSGELKSSSGYELNLEAGWRLSEQLTVSASVFFARTKLEFGGESSHQDTLNGPAGEPVGYDQARQKDTLQGLSLGASFAL